MADRDGKMEDRPLRIKADTFPYRENIDINGYLTVLAQHGFIRRYLSGGVDIIQVTKFKDHQSPHKTERDSVLPDYDPQAVENKEENKLTVNAPLKDDGLTAALPPESISLITESISLITEGGKRPSAYAPPLPADLLKDFLQVRKAKKAGPITQTVVAGLQREADKAGISLVDAVTACCEFGWQGFNAQWYADRTAGRPASTTASNRQPESFAERDARNGREAWERMTGREWPADELPGGRQAVPTVIDIESTEIKRL